MLQGPGLSITHWLCPRQGWLLTSRDFLGRFQPGFRPLSGDDVSGLFLLSEVSSLEAMAQLLPRSDCQGTEIM